MTATYTPVRLRLADFETVSSRPLSQREVCPPIQVSPEQVEYIARREFRIDEIQSLFRAESRPQESAQDDKWSFCLTAGTLCPANQERQ